MLSMASSNMALAKSALFNTVPEEDYLHLFPKGHLDGKKVVDLLSISYGVLRTIKSRYKKS